MKPKILLLAIVFFPLFAYSQIMVSTNDAVTSYETLDTAVLKILYEYKFPGENLIETEKNDVVLQTDYMVMEFGSKGISRFYSDNRRRMDSLTREMIKLNPTNFNLRKEMMDKNGISSSGTHLEVYKNYPEGKITVTDRIGGGSYLYEEPANEIQWQITSDTMTCLDYPCQKAICDFRGRHYEAWFTSDVPINDGPWKFSGLPGLILNVSDSDNTFIFKAIGLENSTVPILFPKKNYLKASRKEVAKVKKKTAEDPIGSLTNSNPGKKISIKIVGDDGIEKTPNEVKFRYIPMELD